MAYLSRFRQQLFDITPEGGLLCQGLFGERLLHPVLTSFFSKYPKVRDSPGASQARYHFDNVRQSVDNKIINEFKG
jgi:hypothetical protein